MTRAAPIAIPALAACLVLACGDTQGPPMASESLLPDSAEQLIIGADFILTDKGVRRAFVHADTILMYDDATREELRRVKSTFFTPTGEQDAIMTADRGTHNNRLGSMEARGSVVVISSEGEQLDTPHLRFDPQRNEISSDSSFTLTQGERITKGVGFVSNPDMSNMRILRAAQVTGTSVKIPRR